MDAGRRWMRRACIGPSTPPARCSARRWPMSSPTRLGVAWRPPGKGLIEIAGIPADVLTVFSKRRSRDRSRTWPPTASKAPRRPPTAMLATRTVKADVDPAGVARSVGGRSRRSRVRPRATRRPCSRPAAHLADDAELIVAGCPMRSPASWSKPRSAPAAFAAWVGERMADIDSTCTRHQITEIVAGCAPRTGRRAASSRSPPGCWPTRTDPHHRPRRRTATGRVGATLDQPAAAQHRSRTPAAIARSHRTPAGGAGRGHRARRSPASERWARIRPPRCACWRLATAGRRCSSGGPGPARPTPWPRSAASSRPRRAPADRRRPFGPGGPRIGRRGRDRRAHLPPLPPPRRRRPHRQRRRRRRRSGHGRHRRSAPAHHPRPRRRGPGDPRRRSPSAARDRRRRRLRRRCGHPRRPTSPS